MESSPLNDRRIITGWALFDWANSAYFLVIATAVFPIYYTSIAPEFVQVGSKSLQSSALFSYSVSFAYIILALASPILSGIADYGGRRKLFMRLFTTVGALSCLCMFLFIDADTVWIGTLSFIVSTIGAAGALVFYDSYLPQIVTEDRMDATSAKGYAYGYVGSVLLLIFCLFLISFSEKFGITSATLPSRLSFVLVGLWWLGFSQITFMRLPNDHHSPMTNFVARGFSQLRAVWEKVRTRKDIVRFLTAYFFYNAGVLTVIYVATIFAQEELHFEKSALIMTVLLLQIVAVIGAYLFARVSKAYGNKAALIIMVIIWMVICLGAYFVQESTQFYILAAFVGIVLGGIQSLSRSTYSKLLRDMTDNVASYFSFYDVLTKISLVMGTFLFGLAIQITGNMRSSVLVLSVLFLISLGFLLSINMRRMHEPAGDHSG